MKRALALNAINPKIGGVLIRGKKGTAKSTAVRALAALLPDVTVLRGCPYSCPPEAKQGLCQWCETESMGQERDKGEALTLLPASPPLVVTRRVRIAELPVGATEDRLVGSLTSSRLLKLGPVASSRD